MNIKVYSDLWGFFGEYLPDYDSRDDVLESDILFRFIDGDEIWDSDLEWIKEEYNNDIKAVTQKCIQLEKRFFAESIENFYDQLIKRNELEKTNSTNPDVPLP